MGVLSFGEFGEYCELTVNMKGLGEDGDAKNCSTKGARVLSSGSGCSSRGSSRLRFAFTRGARPSGRTCFGNVSDHFIEESQKLKTGKKITADTTLQAASYSLQVRRKPAW